MALAQADLPGSQGEAVHSPHHRCISQIQGSKAPRWAPQPGLQAALDLGTPKLLLFQPSVLPLEGLHCTEAHTMRQWQTQFKNILTRT